MTKTLGKAAENVKPDGNRRMKTKECRNYGVP